MLSPLDQADFTIGSQVRGWEECLPQSKNLVSICCLNEWMNEWVNKWMNKSCPGYFYYTWRLCWYLIHSGMICSDLSQALFWWILKTCPFRIWIHFQNAKQRLSAPIARWEDDKSELACRHGGVLISCDLFALLARGSCLSVLGSMCIEYCAFNFWDTWSST